MGRKRKKILRKGIEEIKHENIHERKWGRKDK